MRKIIRMGRRGKRGIRVSELASTVEDVDARVEMIQALIPLGLEKVKEELQEAVHQLVGPAYQRQGGDRRYYRWGKEKGSVYLADQKVPTEVPRVRDVERNREVRLPLYEQLQEPRGRDEQLMGRVLRGLGCRNYRETAALVPEVFGLSASTISRRFIRASARKLAELMERDLGEHDFVGLFLDGKSYGDDGVVIAIGVTMDGKKVILGLVETASENATVCGEFLDSLVERGFRFEEGLLAVIDGSKGLHRAVRSRFKGYVVIQRCRWHKRENVLQYLPKSQRAAMRRKIQAAYQKSTYAQAKAALARERRELLLMNRSAAKSLDEGLEETLTLHRLGLAQELALSFSTTNVVESIQAHIGRLTDHVDYFRNSEQKQRWIASALLTIEPRLRRVRGKRHLPALREAIQRELGIAKRQAVA